MTTQKIFAFLLIFASSSAALAQTPAYNVRKADGSVEAYQFLPVHFDPAQAAVVERRLKTVRADLPSEYTIPKELLPEVRDQGERGTCAYFSTLAAVESYYIQKTANHPAFDLSVECLAGVRNWMFDAKDFVRDDKPDQRPDPDGDLPISITKTINYEGVPATANYSEAKCKYGSRSTIPLATYQHLMSSAAEVPTPFGRGVAFDNNQKPTIDDIKELLTRNIPVVVGILVYKDYFDTNSWQWAGVNHSDSNLAGGHAVLLTGYQSSGGWTRFNFKNSWGKDWGSRGYGKIDDQLLIHSWSYDPGFDFITSLHD